MLLCFGYDDGTIKAGETEENQPMRRDSSDITNTGRRENQVTSDLNEILHINVLS